jgi:hypothetical protein
MDVKRLIKGSQEYVDTYCEALKWWSFWKFPAPPIEFLPEVMVSAYNENGPVAICFIYKTDSQLCWIEWIVADNKASKEDRALALEMLISSSKVIAVTMGFKAIFTCSKNKSLSK